MWSRRISSGTKDYPAEEGLIRALLAKLVQRGDDSSWVHFEVIAKGGWFSNLVSGGQYYVEVTPHGAHELEVNLGFDEPARAKLPAFPVGWKKNPGDLQYVLPVGDVDALAIWIRTAFESVAERADQRITGWMEGL